jgi:DNA-binding transcriptional ArsR family regulator
VALSTVDARSASAARRRTCLSDGVTSTERAKINDPAVMRALAHPARLELLEHLSRATDGATATECAAVIGLSPSATSYHLRALAKVGMIHEAPGRGDGRERLWQATYQSYDVGNDPDAPAEDKAAGQALVEMVLARQNDKVRRSMSRLQDQSGPWYEVATVSDQTLAATPDEIRDLLTAVDELVGPLKRTNRPNPPDDARSVSFQMRAVPLD